MPIGVFINCAAIALGGILGAALRNHIPHYLKTNLTMIFGFSSMLIGMSLISSLQNLAPVVLALIVGTAIGELLHIEDGVHHLTMAAQKKLSGSGPLGKEQMEEFLAILVLFCASGTGIVGSLNEGITGDPSVLIAKSILDFFTAAIFAANIGVFVSWISVPQLVIFSALFFGASAIMPLINDSMMGDFRAVGGLLVFMTGFKMLKIKSLHLLNVLPALVLVFPISWGWCLIF